MECKLASLFGQGFHMPTAALFPGNCLQGNICCGCQLHIWTAQGRRAMGRPRAWEGKGRGHRKTGRWVPAAHRQTPAARKTLGPEVTRCCCPAIHRDWGDTSPSESPLLPVPVASPPLSRLVPLSPHPGLCLTLCLGPSTGLGLHRCLWLFVKRVAEFCSPFLSHREAEKGQDHLCGG